MINYCDFKKNNDTALNIIAALKYCKENSEDKLVFPKDTYYITNHYAEERFLAISNHSTGLRRCCFLLEGVKNFNIDFNGSTLVFEDLMIPFVLNHCENIKIENFKVLNKVQLSAEGVIEEVYNDGFAFRQTNGTPLFLKGNMLYAGEAKGLNAQMCWFNEWDRDTGLMTDEYSDIFCENLTFAELNEEKGNKFFRAFGDMTNFKMKKNNLISIEHCGRISCGVFLRNCVNTTIEKYTIYNGVGMGLIAQNCENIEVNKMKVIPQENSCFSINADATHFVHCSGLIHIHDSLFEGQLDDALNVHSIYLRVVEKKKQSVILKYMHSESLGIDIVQPGDILETCDSLSLIPKKQYRVCDVNKFNIEYVEVFFKDDISDIQVGDNMNEISKKCNVLFENCVIRNNRARGMLLAGNGKTEIKNNIFETPGAAIKLESDGSYWFESGGVNDVLVEGNTFKNCGYVKGCWESIGIIDVMKRPAIEKDKYFHGRIAVRNNKFINCNHTIVNVNNAEEFIFEENKVDNCSNYENIIEHVKTIRQDGV